MNYAPNNRLSSQDSEIVTRFAPSPTGKLHIGGLRTALFAYLLAKSKNGKFYLRIEDTDKKRSDHKYTQDIMHCLRWAGLNWDDSAVIQSHNQDYYQIYIDQLLKSKHAYYCFCIEKNTSNCSASSSSSFIQTNQSKQNCQCRHLDRDYIDKKLANNRNYPIKIKLPETGSVELIDGLRTHPIRYLYKDLDDFIIVKSNGVPTYHLAHILDDHALKVTDVLRGNEWIPTYPVHHFISTILFEKTPRYYHLPLILSKHGGKLSKRKSFSDEITNVSDLKNQGFLPEAIINYVALLGWSYHNQEFFSLEEMLQKFDISSVSISGAQYNRKKLNSISNHYFKKLTNDQFEKQVTDYFRSNPILIDNSTKALKNSELITNNHLTILLRLSKLYQSRLTYLNELTNYLQFYPDLLDNYQKKKSEKKSEKKSDQIYNLYKTNLQIQYKNQLAQTIKYLNTCIEVLNTEPDDLEFIAKIKTIAKDNDLQLSDYFKPLRLSITGNISSPSISKIISILIKSLGKKSIVCKIDAHIEILTKQLKNTL